ncbi:hypothetical protein ACFPPA_17835 [Rhodanobacter ginsengisoli]|uniref:Porin n=1 Tax=Rhodanobacter ginsengisoli TaxID=418646 RepID=A0ABW0QRL2_9GAMM
MKRNTLFCALAVAMGLAVATPALARSTNRQDKVEALTKLVEKQQQQLDQQQADLQALRESLKRLESRPVEQQAQASPPVAPAAVEPAKPVFTSAPGVSVALHGFVNATAFSQNRSFTFGNGQNAEFPEPGSSGRLSGVDVRNTRFWLDFSGAKFAGDWTGGGRIEMDFFGGFNGTGAYSQQQPTPRLRQAYMDLTNPDSGSTVRIGQQWDLMFPLDNTPSSLSHIAFPLGYGTGLVGWRFPGVVLMQELNHGSSGAKWRLDIGAFEGHWSGPGNDVNYLTAGNVGFRPQVEAKLRVQDKTWVAYAAAHYSQVDLKGVGGTAPTPVKSSVKSVGYEVGGQWKPGPWVFKGLVYSGKGMGQIFGALVQFGDIKETGGFLQAGYSFTPNWSANAFYGISKPKTQDVIAWMGNGASGRLKNRQAALGLQYTSGAYDLGVEWIYDKLDSTSDGVDRKTTNGNQVSLSALYHF